MISGGPRVAVVIVNYKAGALVARHYDGLAREIAGLPGALVYIVDNASPNGDAALLAALAARPEYASFTRFIASPLNGGFAKGNNLAFRAALAGDAPPDYFFLLNPDAYVRPGAIAALLRFMDAHPGAGYVGARLEHEDGTPQVSAFRFFSVASEFETGANISLVSKVLTARRVAPAIRDEAHETDWVCGAGMLIRREALEAAGLFDEEYFLYYEETDLMLAGARAGWRTWYAPDARVVHLVGRSTGVVDGALEGGLPPPYWYHSRAYYFRKNHGALYAFLADAAYAAGLFAHALGAALKRGGRRSAWPAFKRFAKAQFGGGLEQAAPARAGRAA